MPITNHVTSLELSRRLKELNVPQKSYFVWKPLFENKKEGKWRVSTRAIHAEKYDGELVSAYLASELGEFIGNALENGEDKDLPEELQPTTFQDIWNPDYLAKLLIWLLENHLISIEELGK